MEIINESSENPQIFFEIPIRTSHGDWVRGRFSDPVIAASFRLEQLGIADPKPPVLESMKLALIKDAMTRHMESFEIPRQSDDFRIPSTSWG